MEKKTPIDKIHLPFQQFIRQEKSGGFVLGVSVILALICANSPWSEWYHQLFEHKLGFTFDGETYFEYALHHWINDGLMAMFFFVVGLELKREMISGELSRPRQAALPIIAALGGMIVPALIYFSLNPSGEVQHGWGIPMATDIAFALGVLYLLGDRIPISLKIFLTALAIVDDLGAVLVIAFFYTSEIHVLNLFIGLLFLCVMYFANRIGVKNIFFYAILGIAGVWMAFLLSGVHATIAAVLAAFMIPVDVRIKTKNYLNKINPLVDQIRKEDKQTHAHILSARQLHLLEEIKINTNKAIPPLQRLEHSMHTIVTFVILPVFALSNAGVSIIDIQLDSLFYSNVLIGVGLGLLFGKVIGVVGFTWLSIKLKIANYPKGMNIKNLFGLGLLATIGFTMSLFITNLAFTDQGYITQAKIGIFIASIIGGMLGYFILKKIQSK